MIWFAKDMRIPFFSLLWIACPNLFVIKQRICYSRVWLFLRNILCYKLYFRILISKFKKTVFYKIEYFITLVIWLGKVTGKNFLQWILINYSLYVQNMINNVSVTFPVNFSSFLLKNANIFYNLRTINILTSFISFLFIVCWILIWFSSSCFYNCLSN